MDKPYSPSCDRNREPILVVLREYLVGSTSVLEIGSDTGQHAVTFTAVLPHLRWQTSDRASNLPGIRAWLDQSTLPSTTAPLLLDVNGDWPSASFDAVFSANTLPIMGWDEAVCLFARLQAILAPAACVIVYGPFNHDGRFTSDGNAAFDAQLKAGNPRQGFRNFEDVEALVHQAGRTLVESRAMPANNRCVIWRRGSAVRERASGPA